MGGFDPQQLQNLLGEARKKYEDLQKKIQETVVEGSAGGGVVTVRMDGQKRVLQVTVDPETVKAGDVEMLQDLIAAAVNAAGSKVDGLMKPSLGGMLSGMGLPGIG